MGIRRFGVVIAVFAIPSFAVAWGAVACDASGNELAYDAAVPDEAKNRVTSGDPPFYLTSLSVSIAGSADASSALVPEFSPDVHDYYVRCQPGVNALRVTMQASPGATSSTILPTTSHAGRHVALTLDVVENQAIVAVASVGSATNEYWVRCLPHDFPPLKMELHPEAGAPPPPGYYIIGTSAPTSSTGYAMMVNGNGVPVWYTSPDNAQGVQDVDAIVDGSAIGFLPGYLRDLPIEVFHMSLSPPMTTAVAPAGPELDTHEFQILPNGDYLAISAPTVSGVDLTGVHVEYPDGGLDPLGPNSTIHDCHIIEFEPKSGKVVWAWKADEHFELKKDSVAAEATYVGTTLVVDAYHCNSIDIDPKNGNLLVSARNMNSIFYIDKTSGLIVWKMGGSPYTKEGAKFIALEDPFYGQHDARLQAGWSAACGTGQVSVFDDHTLQPGPARGLVLDVVTGAPLEPGDGGKAPDCGAASTGQPRAKTAWQYASTVNSDSRGSFRILPDGSRVIGWGSGKGRTGPVFTEVDEAGHDLLDFYFADTDVSYRALKVPLDAFDLTALRLTAGLP